MLISLRKIHVDKAKSSLLEFEKKKTNLNPVDYSSNRIAS